MTSPGGRCNGPSHRGPSLCGAGCGHNGPMEQPLNTAVAILTALECQDEVGFYMVLDDLEPMEVYSSLVLMCRTLTEMISRRDGISEQEVLQLVARAAAECGG